MSGEAREPLDGATIFDHFSVTNNRVQHHNSNYVNGTLPLANRKQRTQSSNSMHYMLNKLKNQNNTTSTTTNGPYSHSS